jgi:hypothetical protein
VKKKPIEPPLVLGRRGPATNLRPAGAFADRRRVSRAKLKAHLRRTAGEE